MSRVLLAQQGDIGQVVQGAYHYFNTIATGAASNQKLPDGSTYAFFNTFILFSDVNSLVCNLLAPATPGLSFLQPIQQALAGSGSAFNCTSQLAAFNAAQGTAASGDGRRRSGAVRECGPVRHQPGVRHRRDPQPVQRHRSGWVHQRPARGELMRVLRRVPSSALKFAVFALVCVLLLVGLAAKIGNLSLFSDRHPLNAQLSDVTGLAAGDPVNIAGVPVGQVSSIAVQHGHALVGMNINNTVTLHGATDVGLRWKNVIGEKEIEIFPYPAGPIIPAGGTIPLGHDVSDSSVNAFLNTLGPLLSSINPHQANEFVENVSGALEGDTSQIEQLINNGATVSNTVGALDSQVGQVIVNLNQVLTAVASRSGDLGSLGGQSADRGVDLWRRRTHFSTMWSETCRRWRPTWPA